MRATYLKEDTSPSPGTQKDNKTEVWREEIEEKKIPPRGTLFFNIIRASAGSEARVTLADTNGHCTKRIVDQKPMILHSLLVAATAKRFVINADTLKRSNTFKFVPTDATPVLTQEPSESENVQVINGLGEPFTASIFYFTQEKGGEKTRILRKPHFGVADYDMYGMVKPRHVISFKTVGAGVKWKKCTEWRVVGMPPCFEPFESARPYIDKGWLRFVSVITASRNEFAITSDMLDRYRKFTLVYKDPMPKMIEGNTFSQ